MIHRQIDTKIGLIFETSYLKTFENSNQLKMGLFFNLSPFLPVQGYYTFFQLGYESSGTFRQNLNYKGIKMNYFFLRKKKVKTAKEMSNQQDEN